MSLHRNVAARGLAAIIAGNDPDICLADTPCTTPPSLGCGQRVCFAECPNALSAVQYRLIVCFIAHCCAHDKARSLADAAASARMLAVELAALPHSLPSVAAALSVVLNAAVSSQRLLTLHLPASSLPAELPDATAACDYPQPTSYADVAQSSDPVRALRLLYQPSVPVILHRLSDACGTDSMVIAEITSLPISHQRVLVLRLASLLRQGYQLQSAAACIRQHPSLAYLASLIPANQIS